MKLFCGHCAGVGQKMGSPCRDCGGSGLLEVHDPETVVTTFGPLAAYLDNAETLHKPYTDDASLQVDTTREEPVSSLSGGAADSPLMRATEIAGRASDLVGGDRDRQHGQKYDNFNRIATMWNAWLQTRRDPAEPLSAHDVGIMMTLMKAARTQSGALNIDDYVDGAGYMACAGEIAQSHGM